MPRKTAYQVLNDVMQNGAYASLSMKQIHHLDGKDMALVSALVYGVLRNWELLKLQWSQYVTKKVSKKTEVLLNLGVYQLLYMDRIPDYAVIDETVSLASKHEKGFVNAVLRKCQGKPLILSEASDIVQRTSVNCSVPEWILNLWKKQYSEEFMIKIAESTLNESSMTARINPLKAKKDELMKDERITFIDDLAFVYDGNLVHSEWFSSGKAVIQDLSSQKAARYLDVQRDDIVLDACSAPGGKTTLMAALMQNTGKVVACDLYDSRLSLVQEACSRLGITNVMTQEMDSTKAHEVFEAESFDRMLLDVPCSGLGTLRQKPEIVFTLTPSNLDEIVRIQKEILDSCSSLLKKGGTMVYSTCTLNQKENSKQIKAFIERHPEYELVSEETCFPFEGDWDGFYMAKLLKTK
ncbi:MAG: 16S rRNA (cytosine(967)-C(5))-methyltransferase RsmB [Erysipelotrichaceae bacterium]|nr:16S rRNA (cytosine(967)-C(5))-methyltransferase RsmB [Erysipelotrichaceae bacterium]MBQ7890372.1 16S rRNA (cytosine(967)-C(5))-methyltransferase RsmB [Erysipelotrichaceae bacterium]